MDQASKSGHCVNVGPELVHELPETWTPPRAPRAMRLADLPFRRNHRAPVQTRGAIMEPGHPGRADVDILDICADGVFVADSEHTLGRRGTSVRIGLPAVVTDARLPQTVWATGSVRWRGEKHGHDGVGVCLTFDDERARRRWRRAVAEFMEARLTAGRTEVVSQPGAA